MKKISLRFLLATAALAALVVGFAGCATTPEAPANALRVGVTPNYPPIIYKQGGQITGMEAEFARKLAPALGKQLQFVELPFDQLLPALDKGKIDIVMSGMTVTSARTPLAQFCNSYAVTGQALLVRSNDLWTYTYPEAVYVLRSRIGVEKGTIAEMLARRRCPNATVTTYSSPEAAAAALQANRIDVVMADAPVIWHIGATQPGLTPVRRLLTREDLAWAVQRGNLPLLNAANAALAKWRADGTLAAIVSAYFPIGR